MNIALWILRGLLAVHTVIGAVWKISNSEQAVPSLSAIPHGLWLALIVAEFAFAIGLLVPALYRPLAVLVPLAAIGIALEMLLFTGVHIASGDQSRCQIVYWLVVVAICAIIAAGRLWLRPI